MYCNSTLDELVPQPQPQQYNYIILLIGGVCESKENKRVCEEIEHLNRVCEAFKNKI